MEAWLTERGLTVISETSRPWCQKVGPAYAPKRKRQQGRFGDTWHMDEVFVPSQGQRHYLWRAVDQDGDVLDILVHRRRNQRAAERAYNRLLQNVTREQAWTPWVMFILEVVEETCTWTTDKIKAIRELMEHTAQYVQYKMPKIYTWELVELLFKQPYCRIGNLVDAGVAKRQTASVDLKHLCDAGILKEIKSERENIFVHPKYIELLTGEENIWVFYVGIETETAVPD